MYSGSYRVVTPSAYIGVRGTDFLVTVTDDSTVVDLCEGEIEVEDTRGGDDTVAPVAVAAGQSVTLSPPACRTDNRCGDATERRSVVWTCW